MLITSLALAITTLFCMLTVIAGDLVMIPIRWERVEVCGAAFGMHTGRKGNTSNTPTNLGGKRSDQLFIRIRSSESLAFSRQRFSEIARMQRDGYHQQDQATPCYKGLTAWSGNKTPKQRWAQINCTVSSINIGWRNPWYFQESKKHACERIKQ